MNKSQVLKFWKAIDDSTSMKETISFFKNKKGYGGQRTLERYSQAASGFKEWLPSEEISKKTGWSAHYVDKIRNWWEDLGKTIRPTAIPEVAVLLKELIPNLEQSEAHDLNRVAVSRKRGLAERMREALAGGASNEIYSVTGLQERILESTPERRTECLRETLDGLDLTPAEEDTLVGSLTDNGLSQKLRNNAEAIYHRIKTLEQYHSPLTTSDVMLIETAAEMDDDQFNKVLKIASYNEEPDYNADVTSAATKLLLDVGEQVVFMDEVEKDTRIGLTGKATMRTAQGRMELAKRLAASWFPRFIRAFALGLTNETKPATRLVNTKNGKSNSLPI